LLLLLLNALQSHLTNSKIFVFSQIQCNTPQMRSSVKLWRFQGASMQYNAVRLTAASWLGRKPTYRTPALPLSLSLSISRENTAYVSSSCSWRVRRVSCSLILQMKLVPPSLPRSSYVSSSFWFIL
jgi:hypothetical protein